MKKICEEKSPKIPVAKYGTARSRDARTTALKTREVRM